MIKISTMCLFSVQVRPHRADPLPRPEPAHLIKKGSLVRDPEFLSPKRSPRMVSYEDENLVRSPQIWSVDLCISCCSPYPVMGAFFLNLNDCNFQCMVQCRAFHWCDKAKNWTKANSDKKCHKRLSYKKVSYTFIMQICLSTLPTKCDILSS